MTKQLQQITYFVPKGSGANPYLEMLRTSLTNHRIRIERGYYNLQWLRKRSAQKALLHFHWPSLFYTSPPQGTADQKIRLWQTYLRTARDRKIPIVWTAHNLYAHDAPLKRFEHEARQILVNHANHIIVHCSLARQELCSRFKRCPPISIMPHPHYCGAYPAVPEREMARQQLQLNPSAFILLFFGLLRNYKGVHSLLDALQQMKDQRIELIIAGKPHSSFDANVLRQQVAHNPRVHLYARHIGKRMTSMLFGAADVVALPYENTLTSGALVLAHSMGRPAIAPAIGCIKEMLPEGTGLTYDAGKPHGLAEAIAKMKDCDCDEMGRNGKRFAQRYGWDECAFDTLNIYRRIRDGFEAP